MNSSDHDSARIVVAETARLIIRRLTHDDLDALAPLLADPDVMRFSYAGPKTRQQTIEYIERALAMYATDEGRGVLAITRKTDDAFIGFCGYFRRETAGVMNDEIGYRLARQFWNQGYATEAVTAVRDVAFERYGVERLIAAVDRENTASARVVEKIGMQFEYDADIEGSAMKIYSMISHSN